MSEDLTREEVHAAVDRAVEELLEAARVCTPPVDAVALAQRHLGMVVALDRDRPARGRGQRGSHHPEPTAEQEQWTVAHEIGKRLEADLLRRLGIEAGGTRPMTGGSLTNLFAARLLVPSAWLSDDARACGHDLEALKERYATASHEVIARRLLDLPEPCIFTVVDNDHVHWRRSNAWPVRKALEPAERQCQRYVNHYSRPHVVRAGGWTVQGWPVHQPDWKREILRSVVETEG